MQQMIIIVDFNIALEAGAHGKTGRAAGMPY